MRKHLLVIRNLRVWTRTGVSTRVARGSTSRGRISTTACTGCGARVLDGHEHNNVRYEEVKTQLFFPRHAKVGGPSDDTPYPEDRPVDDLAPTTVVTSVGRVAPGVVRVRGTAADNSHGQA